MKPTTTAAAAPTLLRRSARLALRVLLAGSAIAVLTTLAFGQSFAPTWIYTVCITAGCWGAIQGGLTLGVRLFGERRPGWPPLAWTVLTIVLGTVLGYSVGNAVANLVTGLNSPGVLASLSRQALAPLLFSLLPGIGFTWYFHTRERIASAEAQAQAAQRLAAEHQLRLLQSQLEPHMLFNTLANLRVLIGLDAARAQAMLDHLIAFLRATLAASRAGEHALADEFARLSDYLALMAIRMGPRLSVQVDLPEALKSLPVPVLLLQPLVENSIQHGLEPQVAGGRIHVAARRDGERLRLTVHDTGVGLREPARTGGFGTQQVRERLAALYGDRASFTLEPAAGGGTLATLTLPLPESLPAKIT